ncbi:MAG TPA: MFS transporter [Thermoanaerobaculia bacterium]|nr:MFS transporter [Thermoanaerobaculia bacterium]
MNGRGDAGGDVRRLAALMFTGFVDTLGVFLVLALLPFYARELGAGPVAVGALVSAFAVAQTISAPLWGRASDRWGRRPIILLGLALSIVAYLIFAFAESLWLLLASRLVQGLGGGTVSVVFAYISDAVPPAHRAERIGWVTAATSGAAMVGPAVGSVAVRFDPAYPGLAAALLCVLSLALAAVWLPEPAGVRRTAKPAQSLRGALARVVAHPAEVAPTLIWIYALGMLATTALTAIIGLYLDDRFGVGEGDIWVFFTYLAGLSLVARVTVLGPLVRALGEVRVLRLGALLLAAGLLAMPWPGTAYGMWWAVPLVALGNSLLYPCTTALVSRSARRAEETGQILGVQQAFGGLARIGGPLVAGALFGHVGPAAPFLAAGLLMVVTAAWALRLPRAVDGRAAAGPIE